MVMRLDHVVLWVSDPVRSAEFFDTVVGLTPVRLDEFRAGRVSFPSVRVSDDSIIDLMPMPMAAALDAMAKSFAPIAASSAGHRVNHACLAMSEPDFTALRRRLQERGVACSPVLERSFGARGLAPQAFYFHDPDGNVLEARYYD